MKNCMTLPIFTRWFYSDPFCRKACTDSRSAEKPSTTHCFLSSKPQQWPMATLREARGEVNTTKTQEAAHGWDVGEVGLNRLTTQLWTRACTQVPGCNRFFHPRILLNASTVQRQKHQEPGYSDLQESNVAKQT